MSRCLWVWVCLLVLCVGCDSTVDPDNPYDPDTPAAQQAKGTITGRLVAPEGASQDQVAQMRLSLTLLDSNTLQETITVDESGSFVFTDIPAGDWQLEGQGGSLYLPRTYFTLPVGEGLALGLLQTALRPTTGALSGVARLAWGGDGGHGDILVAVRGGVAQTRTLADGSFILPVPEGRHDIEFSHPDYTTEVVPQVKVEGETALESPVVLQGEPIRMVGRVQLDGLESAERTATIGVELLRGEARRQLTVDGTGRFADDDLSPGVYTLVASRAGYRSVERSFQVAPGGYEDVGTLVLQHSSGTGDAVPFFGRVLSVGAASQAGVEVVVRLAGSELIVGEAVTDASGDFRVPVAADEQYVFTAERADYVPHHSQSYSWDMEAETFRDGSGNTPKADLLAEDPRGSVTFDLAVGPDWLPLEARTARVLITRRGEVLPELVGSDGQRIRVDNLQPGSYRLVAGRPGFSSAEAQFEIQNLPGGLDVQIDGALTIQLSNLTESGIELGQVVQAEWLQGVEVAGAALSRRTLVGDFGGLDLTGVRLPDCDLTQADFAGAQMANADLSRVVATGTGFVGANLTGALFSGARLDGARFHCAERLGDGRCDCGEALEGCVTQLTSASLSNASISGADFSGALMDDTQLTGAIFGLSEVGVAPAPPLGCDLPSACRWDDLANCEAELPEGCGGLPTRFTGASMRGASMPGTVLEHVDFSDADLYQANLNNTTITFNTHMRRADLSEAQLRVARLNGADLREAILAEAVMNDADLTGANLSGVDATGVVLQGADLSRSILRGVQLQGADLRRALFAPDAAIGARLDGADMRGVELVSRPETGPLSLDGALLEDARLEGAFWGWSFRGISGRGIEAQNGAIQLIGCDFTGADLTEAIFILGGQGDRSITMDSTIFDEANLTDARFLTAAGFMEAPWETIPETRRKSCENFGVGTGVRGDMPNIRWTSFRRARLDGFFMSGFDFSGDMSDVQSAVGASFASNRLYFVQMNRSNFSGANFTYNRMFAVDLREANLEGTSFAFSSWKMVDVRRANLRRAALLRFNSFMSYFDEAVADRANLDLSCFGLNSMRDASFVDAWAGTQSDMISNDVEDADFTGAFFNNVSVYSTPFSDDQINSMDMFDVNVDENGLRLYVGADLRDSFVSGLAEQALNICDRGGSCEEMAASCADYENDAHYQCQDMTCLLLLNGGCENPGAFFGNGLDIDFCDILPQDPTLLVDTCRMYEGAMFTDANMEGVDAFDSKFDNAMFNRANLRGLVFPDTHLGDTLVLNDADMTGADFTPVTIEPGTAWVQRYRIAMLGTILDGAELGPLWITQSDFQPASVEGAFIRLDILTSRLRDEGHALVRHYADLLEAEATGGDWAGEQDIEHFVIRATDVGDSDISNARLPNNAIGFSSNWIRLNAVGAQAVAFNLDATNLTGANFTDATLTYGGFSSSMGWRTNFTRADLSGAFFRKAALGDVDAAGADLSGAHFQDAFVTFQDLTGADLSDTDLRSFDLSGMALSGARLIAVEATGATLSGADLRRADLTDGVFDEAHLGGADFTGGDLSRASFQHARMSSADLRGCVLEQASLQGADLAHANLSGVDLRTATLTHARLAGASLTGAHICASQAAALSTGDWSEATIDEGC